MIRMRGWKGHETETLVRSFVNWANKTLKIEHEVTLQREDFVYGMFFAPDRVIDDPILEITVVTALGQGGLDIIDTVAHEVAHFLQWRRGAPINEVGIDAQARAMVRRWRGA